MLENVYNLLKKRQEKQLELKELLQDRWMPYPRLENLVFVKENGNLIEHSVIQYYIRHIQELIARDGIVFVWKNLKKYKWCKSGLDHETRNKMQ